MLASGFTLTAFIVTVVSVHLRQIPAAPWEHGQETRLDQANFTPRRSRTLDILKSTLGYEAYLQAELGHEVVAEGLAEKRAEMKRGPFPFLRATYWRWAEIVLEIAPELAAAPSVLAVGDIHLENFGTWRDADGRLVWGVNDFDEAAEMPYALDLLRLATSGLLAGPGAGHGAEQIEQALLAGYAAGLEKPGPAVLDRDLAWLRQLVVVAEGHRQDFWDKLKKKRKRFEARSADQRPSLWPRYAAALRVALPVGSGEPRMWYRSAGLGSLGRPRWVAEAKWRGDWVVREAKGIVPSAWTRVHTDGGRALRCIEIATGRHRAPDPWFGVTDGVAVRRLSPNNRKIATEKPLLPEDEGDTDGTLGRDVLLSAEMLGAMGQDLASIHLGCGGDAGRIRRDIAMRGTGWLANAARRAAQAVTTEQTLFAGRA
jgi:hypothetical protein